jgi:hypothetical protein
MNFKNYLNEFVDAKKKRAPRSDVMKRKIKVLYDFIQSIMENTNRRDIITKLGRYFGNLAKVTRPYDVSTFMPTVLQARNFFDNLEYAKDAAKIILKEKPTRAGAVEKHRVLADLLRKVKGMSFDDIKQYFDKKVEVMEMINLIDKYLGEADHHRQKWPDIVTKNGKKGKLIAYWDDLMKYRLVSENIEPLPLTSCPIEKIYGGIPTGGGFAPNVEFEVGLQRMAEAAHCILGSLHRAYYTRGYLSGEFAHIEEEFDLIKGFQREYSKDLYVGRVFPLDRKYGPMAIESIRRNAPKLIKQAKDSIRRLDKKKYPKEAYELAKQSYQFLIDLSEAGLKTVSDTNIKTETDIGTKYILFNYLKKLDGAVRELERKVNAFGKIAD